MPSDQPPRSLKGNLLNARVRLGESIIAIVAANVVAHGEEVDCGAPQTEPCRLRTADQRPRPLQGACAGARCGEEGQAAAQARSIRMKELIDEIDGRPIDVNAPLLPPKLALMEELRPRFAGGPDAGGAARGLGTRPRDLV
jgi:hypothetical protein